MPWGTAYRAGPQKAICGRGDEEARIGWEKMRDGARRKMEERGTRGTGNGRKWEWNRKNIGRKTILKRREPGF